MGKEILLEDVAVLEGIGPKYAEKLAADMGVTRPIDLLKIGPARIHQLDKSIPLEKLEKWYAAASLLAAEDISPDLAEAFVEGGIESIDELATCGLRTLELAVKRAHKASRISEVPSLYRLSEIQRNSWPLKGCGLLFGRVISKDSEEPINGATVKAGRSKTQTSSDGSFILRGLPQGSVWLEIESKETGLKRVPALVKGTAISGPVIVKLSKAPAPSKPPKILRQDEGARIVIRKNTAVRFREIDLKDLPESAYLKVFEEKPKGQFRLLHLAKKRQGNQVTIELLRTTKELLPQGWALGSILEYREGSLFLTELSSRDVARQYFEKARGPVKLGKSRVKKTIS